MAATELPSSRPFGAFFVGDSLPIGVFDSGVGGLSVVRALHAELPHEDIVYLADSGFAPYGERDNTFVIDRAKRIARHLCRPDQPSVKALVIACNTATAAAISALRHDYPALPIVGVEPALKPAASVTRTRHIGVLATRGTLGSHKFMALKNSLADQVVFHCTPCDGLADAIERTNATDIKALCRTYVTATGQFGLEPGEIDTLVLGCTHYPFARAVIQELVGPDIQLIDNGEPVARQTRRVLPTPNSQASAGSIRLRSTGQPQCLAQAAQRWLGLSAAVEQVEV